MDVQRVLQTLFPNLKVTKGVVHGEWAFWYMTTSMITFQQLNTIKKKIPKVKIVVEAEPNTNNIIIAVKRFINPF